MSKWLLFLTTIILILGCVPSASSPVQHPTSDQCVMLYHHLVVMAVVNDVGVSNEDIGEASRLVDEQWQREGKTDRLLLSCAQTMNIRQYACAINTSHIEEVSVCVRLTASEQKE